MLLLHPWKMKTWINKNKKLKKPHQNQLMFCGKICSLWKIVRKSLIKKRRSSFQNQYPKKRRKLTLKMRKSTLILTQIVWLYTVLHYLISWIPKLQERKNSRHQISPNSYFRKKKN
jgi:hypothetical protein